MKPIFYLLLAALFISCTGHADKTNSDSSKKGIDSNSSTHTLTKEASNSGEKTYSDSAFERKIYFKIDQLYSGKVYTTKSNLSAFYRVLVVPEEENIMLIAENIQVVDDEGGNLKLISLSRITDDGSALPKFGLDKVDSVKFIDSVTIEGYFNDKKKIINLSKLKPYHPVF